MYYFEQQLQALNTELVKMSAMVEEQVRQAGEALLGADIALARQVIKGDQRVDEAENHITNEAIRILATLQPVAADLRFISGLFRLVTDLERVSDLAVNLAWRTVAINEEIKLRAPFSPALPRMVQLTCAMLTQALDALSQRNEKSALEVKHCDNQLDQLHRNHRQEMIAFIQQRPELAAWGVEAILAGNYLERIGDHITNLCEEIIYLVSGQVIRHCVTKDDK